MASTAAAIEQAASPKRVDESLWWDSFVALLDELEIAASSSEVPHSLVEKLRSNRMWFIDTLSCFKPPNEASRIALDSPVISIGSHKMEVDTELKELALRASSIMSLDEVQSYILAIRCFATQSVVDHGETDALHLVLLQYYLERQCLLKCVREIFTFTLNLAMESVAPDAVKEEAFQLVHGGLEEKMLLNLRNCLHAVFPEKSANSLLFSSSSVAIHGSRRQGLYRTETDIATMWVEETMVEVNVMLDILFVAYNRNFCSNSGKKWERYFDLFKGSVSGSFSIGNLAVSSEARRSFCHVKVLLLFILVETMELDELLKVVFDEASSSDCFFVFSPSEIIELDALVSSLIPLDAVEIGPLLLAWAVLICLVQLIPERPNCSLLVEIDHVGYARRAAELAPFSYLLEVVSCDLLKDSDGPVTCYSSILRTFMSSFLAAYEIPYQLGDATLSLILDILCQIYCDEEKLCTQFWDKGSYIDVPIRSLLYYLESEFPFRRLEFIRFLSSLCGGSWSAECVYNFLDNMRGITLPFQILDAFDAVNSNDFVQAPNYLHIPGVDGLSIPRGTYGQVLKVIDANTVLVRWQHAQSGVLMLVFQLMQEFKSSSYEELHSTLELLYRLVSFSRDVCFSLLRRGKSLSMRVVNGHAEHPLRVDVVTVLSNLVSNLSNDVGNGALISICINILAEMVKCIPSYVCAASAVSKFLGLGDDNSSDSWFLSGELSRLIMADCLHSEGCCPLTVSVLNYAIVLMDVGLDNYLVSSLISFSLQFVLVNHENWKYKLKHCRWIVTLKAFDVLKKCIEMMVRYNKDELKLRSILFGDPSIYSVVFRVMCITARTLEGLFVNRRCELKEVEYLQLAVCSALDILTSLLKELLKMDITISFTPVLMRTMLSPSVQTSNVFASAISLISFSRDPIIQINAAGVVSNICIISARLQGHSLEQFSLVIDDVQLRDLVATINDVLNNFEYGNLDLFAAVVDLMICIADHQPSLFVSIIGGSNDASVNPSSDSSPVLTSTGTSLKYRQETLVNGILKCVSKSEDLFKRAPRELLGILKILKSVWDGGSLYMSVMNRFRNSEKFWEHLSLFFLPDKLSTFLTEKQLHSEETLCLLYRFKCQASVFDIMACDIFIFGMDMDRNVSENQISLASKEFQKDQSSFEAKYGCLTWLEKDVFELLVKLYSVDYRRHTIHNAKMGFITCLLHLMVKLSSGDAGSLSISLVKNINVILKELFNQPAFSALLEQYAARGYSKKDEVSFLILSDLYYHLEGELEGREITPGPFKNLVHYLLELNHFSNNEHRHSTDSWLYENDTYLFDLPCFQAELRTEFWDHSTWKASKVVVDRALQLMHEGNIVVALSQSRNFALKAFLAILSMPKINVFEDSRFLGKRISSTSLFSCIEYLCKSLLDIEDFLISDIGPSEFFSITFISQIELLHALCTFLFKHYTFKANREEFSATCIYAIKTSATALKCLSDISTTAIFRGTVKLLIMLLLTSVELLHPANNSVSNSSNDSVHAELSVLCLGLLPILCKYSEYSEYCNLSIALMDLMLKRILSPSAWAPVLQKHLNLQHLISRLQEKDMNNVLVAMKFVLTFAQTEEGAKMLLYAKLFVSLKFVFNFWKFDESQQDIDSGTVLRKTSDEDSLKYIWIMGMAIVSSIVLVVADDYSSTEIVDSAISYFFFENSSMIYEFLSAPCFSNDLTSKKRPRMQKAQRSLTSLKATEHAFILICALAKHRVSWVKGMAEKDSQLREACIHMLAFISKGVQHTTDMSTRPVLLCPPHLKEEVKANESPAFIGSKKGWFVLSALGVSKSTSHGTKNTEFQLTTKSDTRERNELFQQTHFSDLIAIQLYKIALFLLNFLCMQAKTAAKWAEDNELIDLAQFPQLPTPEILHGIQDQSIAIVIETCQDNKSNSTQKEVQSVCLLLLQILEKSLYLELCVLKSCGIRPVFGRVEDFSKGIKRLMQVAEEHASFKETLRSLRQIIGPLYPGLEPTGNIV